MSRILSAVAWPYANGPRHIGHVAGFGVPSDVFSRYMRMAGHDVLMVSGTDEHGTPILVAADERGHERPRTRRPQQPPHRRGPRGPGPVLRPVHPHDRRQPLPRRPGHVRHRARQRLHDRAGHARRHLPVHRPHPARPLHRGHLPDLWRRGRARRPVRQLRQPDSTRPSSSTRTRASTARPPTSWSPPTTSSTCPPWPRPCPPGSTSARQSGTWRPNVIKFSQNFLEDIRPRAMTRDIDWGIPVPGWEDQPTKRLYVWFDAVIGYLSASIEWARRTGDPEAWRAVVERPRGPVLLLHGQGQHRLPLPDLARRAPGLQRPGRGRRRARATWACSTCPPRSSPPSSSPWRARSSPPPTASSSTCATSSRATRPTPCATSSARPARRPRTPTSPGPSSCVAPTASSSPAGATWSTAPPP